MGSSDRPPDAWKSYDSVADAYDEAAVPRFAAVARDLVAAVALPANARVVDLGTGTGLVAQLAREVLGPGGFVVGIDPSLAMLRRAAARAPALVAGRIPGLPFPDGVFEAALANLVLSHLGDYDRGLADAVRVLRSDGRFGATAWGPEPAGDKSDWAQADEIFEDLALGHGLDVTPPTPPVPSEDRLREGGSLETALRGAGLTDVDVDLRTYHWTATVDEYLLGRAWRPTGRYMRQQADDRLWTEIQGRASAELHTRFGDSIRSSGRLWVAAATKP